MSQKTKKRIMRIIVLVIAIVMFLGLILGTVFSSLYAEEAPVVVESFEKGSFSAAFEAARGNTDQNNIKILVVKNGEFSANDLSILKNLSSCKQIDLGLTTVEGGVIPDGLMSGRSIESFVFPSNVTSIGNNAFSGCGSLNKITFPNGLKTIGNRAFESCSSLETVIIPASVTSIDECAFRGCNLKTVQFEGNAPTISNEVFSGGMKIYIGNGATGFDGEAWGGYSVSATENAVSVVTTVVPEETVIAAKDTGEITGKNETAADTSNAENTVTTVNTTENIPTAETSSGKVAVSGIVIIAITLAAVFGIVIVIVVAAVIIRSMNKTQNASMTKYDVFTEESARAVPEKKKAPIPDVSDRIKVEEIKPSGTGKIKVEEISPSVPETTSEEKPKVKRIRAKKTSDSDKTTKEKR